MKRPKVTGLRRRESWQALPFLLPSLLGLCLFYLFPLAETVRASFMDPLRSRAVGWGNYRALFQNTAFRLAVRNTCRFLCICIPALLAVSLLCAVLLGAAKRRAVFFKSVLLLPYAIPVASIVVLWRALFSGKGLVNGLLVGLGCRPVDFMGSSAAFWVLIFTYLWRNNGYDMLLWLAGLETIPRPLYEAAAVDGATPFQTFVFITLPNLLPTVVLTTILSLVNSFKVFREAYLVAGNYPQESILRIIRHEGYTGYIITKNARSEYIPELQIIDQETFEKANDIISRRSAKTAQDRRIAHTSQNPTLLAGIVYCAHCGAKMSGFMHTDRYKLADGSIREKVQPKYNCFQRGQRNKGGRDCDGQALYLAERVDAIVLKIVEEVFEQIRDTPYSQVAENRIRQESNLQKTKRAAAEKKIKAAQHALERFEGEILKCLDGTSNFTEDMIAKQIRRYQQELDDAKAEYAELRNARLNEAAEIRKLRTYYDDFRGWAEEFDTAPLEMKRMILSHLIDRVEVGRKYQVIVKFNMKYRQFLECTAETYNTEIGA